MRFNRVDDYPLLACLGASRLLSSRLAQELGGLPSVAVTAPDVGQSPMLPMPHYLQTALMHLYRVT